MEDRKIDKALPLPDLRIQNFRGLKDITIPRLGQVTLLVGRNGSGKTTVLEAVRAYASQGRYYVMFEILRERGELTRIVDDGGNLKFEIDWTTLFHGWEVSLHDSISIGPATSGDQLRIETISLTENQASRLARISPGVLEYDNPLALRAVFLNTESMWPGWVVSSNEKASKNRAVNSMSEFQGPETRSDFDDTPLPPPFICEVLGPGLLNGLDVARFWDKVALTDYEDHALRALRLIFGDKIAGVAMIGDDSGGSMAGRTAMVRLKGREKPIPLRSLGDGASRLFGVALALANCRGGFLLIDEAENGIHHRLQGDFWRMVLQAAQDNDVQVIATTHSLDCVRGFARAVMENETSEGVLVRIDDYRGSLRAVEYSDKNLRVAAEQGMEVR